MISKKLLSSVQYCTLSSTTMSSQTLPLNANAVYLVSQQQQSNFTSTFTNNLQQSSKYRFKKKYWYIPVNFISSWIWFRTTLNFKFFQLKWAGFRTFSCLSCWGIFRWRWSMKKIVKERGIQFCFKAPFNDLNNLKFYLYLF